MFNAPNSPIFRSQPGVINGAYGASGAISIKPGVGAEYQNIALKFFVGAAAATRAQIATSIQFFRLTVSGQIVLQLTGTQLNAVNEFYNTGCTGDTGVVWLNFVRQWMRDVFLESAYGTTDQSSFVIDIQFTAGNVITNAVCNSRTSGTTAPLGNHVEYRVYSPNISGTGPQNYADFATRRDFSNTVLLALHLQLATPTDLTNFKMTLDNETVIDIDPLVLNQAYKLSTPIRTPQTGFVHIDFTNENIYGQAIPLNYDLAIIEFNFSSAPGQFPMIAEFAMATLGGKAPRE